MQLKFVIWTEKDQESAVTKKAECRKILDTGLAVHMKLVIQRSGKEKFSVS
jgi:hypothetical protein